jgi:single-stranded DNA-binding protein
MTGQEWESGWNGFKFHGVVIWKNSAFSKKGTEFLKMTVRGKDSGSGNKVMYSSVPFMAFGEDASKIDALVDKGDCVVLTGRVSVSTNPKSGSRDPFLIITKVEKVDVSDDIKKKYEPPKKEKDATAPVTTEKKEEQAEPKEAPAAPVAPKAEEEKTGMPF